MLLLVSTWWDGAFDLRYWALFTIFAVAMLLAMAAAGAVRLPRSPHLRVAIAAIWAYVLFVGLSALWSESPAGAWEGAARAVLFAAAFTLAVTSGSRAARRLGPLLLAGVVVIAAITVVRMLAEGSELFLAGRLNLPLGYRNATAAFFALGLWPLLGVAARRGIPSGLRASAFAAAVAMLGLAFITQSRGVLLGVVAGGVVSIAIGPDRVRRLWLAIAAVAAVALASGGLLVPFHAFDSGAGTVSDADVRSAATTLLLATGLSFLAALLVTVLDNGLRTEQLERLRLRELASAGLVLIAVLGVVVGLAKIGNPVSYADQKLDEFTDLEAATTSSSGTRLGTVGGQRYDLYRIAWNQFLDQPLAGEGEGSYEFAYYRERRTDRNLDNPHSLPMLLLSETGIVGTALFAAWLIAAGLAVFGAARRASEAERICIAGLAAAAATLLAQSVVDWFWLLPGLFAMAALTLGLAGAGEEPEAVAEGEAAPGSGPARALTVAGLGVLVVAVGLLFLSDLYLRRARVEAPADPAAALDSARTAGSLNPLAVEPLYVQASARESQGDRAGARKALEDALEEEPENFVTLALLGDLETRAGRPGQARLYYRRSLRLNPLDVGLRELSGMGRGGESDAS